MMMMIPPTATAAAAAGFFPAAVVIKIELIVFGRRAREPVLSTRVRLLLISRRDKQQQRALTRRLNANKRAQPKQQHQVFFVSSLSTISPLSCATERNEKPPAGSAHALPHHSACNNTLEVAPALLLALLRCQRLLFSYTLSRFFIPPYLPPRWRRNDDELLFQTFTLWRSGSAHNVPPSAWKIFPSPCYVTR